MSSSEFRMSCPIASSVLCCAAANPSSVSSRSMIRGSASRRATISSVDRPLSGAGVL
jgi:hypothetical protein